MKEENRNMLFGDLLRKVRHDRQVSLKELERRTGLDRGLLSKIEHHERRATAEQVELFLRELKPDEKQFRTCWLATRLLQEASGSELAGDAFRYALHYLENNLITDDISEASIDELHHLKTGFDAVIANTPGGYTGFYAAWKGHFIHKNLLSQGTATDVEQITNILVSGGSATGLSNLTILAILHGGILFDSLLENYLVITPVREEMLANWLVLAGRYNVDLLQSLLRILNAAELTGNPLLGPFESLEKVLKAYSELNSVLRVQETPTGLDYLLLNLLLVREGFPLILNVRSEVEGSGFPGIYSAFPGTIKMPGFFKEVLSGLERAIRHSGEMR